MSNVVMCDADECGAFFAEGLEGSSAGIEYDDKEHKQRALHYCDTCTTRRKTSRSQQIFRPNSATVTQIERAQD